jgi:predicted transcriptional regulator of viral defense system
MSKNKAEDLFHQHGGQLRMSQALKGGISRSVLYSMWDKEIIIRVSRGLYRLAELPEHREPDLSIICLRYPRAVICLVSALAYHDLTTQVPKKIYIALPRGTRAPGIAVPPVRPFFISGQAYTSGIEEHDLDGVRIRVYCREKTLADCFRFRNTIGMDVFLEALKLYKNAGNIKPGRILEYARICRVEKAMSPYLEAGL